MRRRQPAKKEQRDHVFLRQTARIVGGRVYAIVTAALSILAIVEAIHSHGSVYQWLIAALVLVAVMAAVELDELHRRQKKINHLEAHEFDPRAVTPEHASAVKAMLSRCVPSQISISLSDEERDIVCGHFPETYELITSMEAANTQWRSDRAALMDVARAIAPNGAGWNSTDEFCAVIDAYVTAGEQLEEGIGSGRLPVSITMNGDLGMMAIEGLEHIRHPIFRASDDQADAMKDELQSWLAKFQQDAAFDRVRASRQRKFNQARVLNGAISSIQSQPTVSVRRTGCSHC